MTEIELDPNQAPGTGTGSPRRVKLNSNSNIHTINVNQDESLTLATESKRYVVQVTIKQAQKEIIKELSTFYIAQHDITKAIESVLHAHILLSLPAEIEISGKGYILKGRRKTWAYGKTLRLRWGDRIVLPCEHKWTFMFETSTVQDAGGKRQTRK